MSDEQAHEARLPDRLPFDLPVVLVLRHAARPPLTDGQTGAELSLTPGGERAARALGQRLGASLRGLRTSPVRRCQQTAAAICHGADHGSLAILDQNLGDPGCFIVEPERAWLGWASRGHEGMLHHLAAGGASLPGFAEPLAASRGLLAHLLAAAGRTPGFHLAITHDALMLSLLAATLARAMERDEWPGFLEAIAVWAHDGVLWLAYRGERHALPG